MKKISAIIGLLILFVVSLSLNAHANPIPQILDAYNGVFFSNSEVLLDNDRSGGISVGDVFWGVLSSNGIKAPSTIYGQTGPTIWPPSPPAEITGYFATRVVAILPPGAGASPDLPTIVFGPVTDPNGILATGEVMRIYEDGSANFNDSTQGLALANATDGILIWSLGLGPSADGTSTGGYWYSIAPVVLPGSGDVGISYAGMNFIITQPTEAFGTVNDPSENFSNGVAPPSGLDVQIYFNSEIFRLPLNPGLTLGPNEPMHFGSNDPAVYLPEQPKPCINIEKEISIDGGITWLDADDVSTAAKATAPHGALYRLIVTNCGKVDLTNVLINDPTLGITNHLVGNLAAGASVTLTSGEIPQLDVPVRCDQAGEFENISSVSGEDASGNIVTDSDPAWLVCTPPPCIDLEKQISIDGGVTWLDADTVDAAAIAEAPHGALYRLIVTNCGDVDLTNVLVNDPTLGITNYLVGNLAAGASVTLTSGEIPPLDVPERCSTAGSFENISCVTGSANGTGVEDCDPAWLVCKQPPTGACRMTHGSVTVNQDGSYTLDGPYCETTQPNPQNTRKNAKRSSSNNTTSAPYYTVGGQIGAPQANDPSYGEWEHQQHDHPIYGSFGFHAGTASASPGTEISSVACADPGWCENARCAPFKQIFWDGIGEFENMSLNNPFPGCTVRQKSHRQGGTLHYLKAHASDFGEPGGNFPPGDGPQPSEALCSWVSGGTDINNVNLIGDVSGVPPPPPGPLHGDKGSQACDECPDYYEIEIHCTTDPNSPIIYQVHDYIDRGNIQIHPEVSQQCPY